jgi:molybdenum cofactor synthesis domain-containing protein
MIRTAILTVSDADPRAEQVGLSIKEIRSLLAKGPFTEVDYQQVLVEQAIIRSKIRLWADSDEVDLILTVGGTGLGQRERTPEATLQVIERPVPGIADLIRLSGLKRGPEAVLSRAIAGVRRQTLIVNLPGGAEAARESLKAILGVLPEAIDTIVGERRSALEAWPS